MKRFFTIVPILLLITISGFSQTTCEQREEKLLVSIGGLSAGFMYTNYISIGSVADGFVKEAYEKETVIELLNDQKKLIDNVIKIMKDLNDNKLLKGSDSTFVVDCVRISDGLKKQAQLFIDYVNNASEEKALAYDKQRQKNWKEIALIMGLEE